MVCISLVQGYRQPPTVLGEVLLTGVMPVNKEPDMALVTWEEFEDFLDKLPEFVGPEMPYEVAFARRVEAQCQRNIADMVRRQEEVAKHNLFLFEEKNRVLNSLD